MNAAEAAGAFRLEIHDELGSTSDEIIRRARAGAPAGVAILARRQSAGRGRRGRSWLAAEGALAVSVLLRPELGPQDCPRLTFASCVALRETLAGLLADPRRLRVKWPNDLLLDGAKLAGILLESEVRPDGRLDWVSIGFGANLGVAAPLPGRRTAGLVEAGRPADPVAVARTLLDRLPGWIAAAPADIRSAWLAHGHAPGERLVVERDGERLEGRFIGLTEGFALHLETRQGDREVTHGTVLQDEREPTCCS